MIPTVRANNLTVVHKNSDGVATACLPDVCKTPTSGGPVPVPYTNVALSKDLINGSATVFADGQSMALKDSAFATSSGDEGGTAGGGVSSGVIKGKAKFSTYSMDVRVEGRNVARLSDQMLMNGNNANTSGVETQGNKVPTDLDDIICTIFCWCNEGNDGGGLFKRKEVPGYPELTA